jgi:hypothetical protein
MKRATNRRSVRRPRNEATGGTAGRSTLLVFVALTAAAAASVHSACGGSSAGSSGDAGDVHDGTIDGNPDVGPVGDAPTDGGPVGDAASPDCANFDRDSGMTDECTSCGANYCCGQAAAFNGADAYVAYIDCIGQGLTELPDGALVPTTTTCEAAAPNDLAACCADAYPSTAALGMAVDECLSANCPSVCP